MTYLSKVFTHLDVMKAKKVYSSALTKLILRLKKLERTVKTSKVRRKAKVVILKDEDAEDPSKQVKSLIEELNIDDDISLVLLHAKDQGRKLDDTQARDKGKAVMQESEPTKKIKKRIQVQMNIDEELARKLHEEELTRFNAEQEAIDIAIKEKVIVEGDQAHDIDWSDPSNQGGFKLSHFKGMSYEDIRPIFKKVWDQIHSCEPMNSVLEVHRLKRTVQEVERQSTKEEKGKKSDDSSKPTRKKTLSKKRAGGNDSQKSVKKQKLEDDTEKKELKAYLDIVLEDEFVMEVKSFATKQDLMDLHRLVEESGIHILLIDNGIAIHMLIEKKYPLGQEMISKMLNKRLEVEQESEMAFELLRFIRSQKNTLAEYMILSGDDNRPPMLDKDLYDSWKSQMELYMQNKEHGRMIFESVERGPLIWPTVKENDVIRRKKYAELSAAEKIQADYDINATNIILQGDDLIACLNKAMVFQTAVASLRFSYTNNQLRTFSNLRNEATIQDDRVIVQQVQGKKGQNYFGNTLSLSDRNATCYKEKAMLAEAQEAGQILDEEQLVFLKDPRIIVAALMANTSNYGSEVISEVPNSETYLNDMDNQSVQALQDFKQSPVMDFIDNEISSDKNIIPYSQYLQETQQATVQDTDLQAQQDSMILSVIEHIVEVLSELPKVSLVNESLKKLKFQLAQFDSVVKKRTTPNALTDGEWGFKHTKDVFNNEIIPFQKSFKTIFNVFDKDHLNEITENDLKAQLKDKDTTIYKLKDTIKSLRNNKKEEIVDHDRCDLATINAKLENSVAKLLSENVHLCKEIKHVKQVFKNLFDSIKQTRVLQKEHSDSLINNLNLKSTEYEDLKAQIQDKVFVITSLKIFLRKLKGKATIDNAAQIPSATTVSPGMFKLDLEPLAPKLVHNSKSHYYYLKYTQEQADILQGIVKQAKTQQPLDNALDFTCKHAKRIQELLVYVRDTCPNAVKLSETKVARTLMNKIKKVTFAKPIASSSTNQKTCDSNKPMLHSTGVKCSTNASGSKPSGNTKNNRISQPSSSNKINKVEDQPRSVKTRKNNKNHVKQVKCDDHVMQSVSNANSVSVSINNAPVKNSVNDAKSNCLCAICGKCMITATHHTCVHMVVTKMNQSKKSQLAKKHKKQKVWKLTGHVFNEQTTSHLVEIQKPEIKVYRKKPKNVKNIAKIVEFKKANHSEPNHTWGSIVIDILSSSSLVMTGTVRFENDQIARIIGYGDYQLGNAIISRKNTCFIRNLEGVDLLSGSHDTNLYTLTFDDMLKSSLIGLFSKASKTKSWLWHQRLSHLNFGTLNKLAKDGLARGIPRLKFQKDHLCSACALGKSKISSHQPKAEDTNKEKLYLWHMDLCFPMRTANINEKRYILVIVDDYSRFTKQNGVVERQNQTLVEAARTMVIFSKAPLYLWAEAINTACYTQNRLLICLRYNKTSYKLMQNKKPDLSFLYISGSLCYPTNDNEDLVQEAADPRAKVLADSPVSISISQDAPSTSAVPPKIARNFKKSSPSKKDSDLVPVDEEHVTKGKRIKRSVKKFSTKPATSIVIKEPPMETKSKRKEKSLRDFHKLHTSGSGIAFEIPPRVDKITLPVTIEGTGDKLGVPDVTKDESTENSESDQQEYDYDDEEEDDDDDKFEGDEDRGKDNAHVMIATVAKETEVPDASGSHSSDLASKFLKFSDIPPNDAKIVSPLDVHVHHEIPPKEVSNFALPVIETMITESLNQVNLGKTSSQPQSTYKAAATLTEFELKKILIVKMNSSESYLTAPKHQECYDGLPKAPSQPKSFGKSVHAEEPEFEVGNSNTPQGQEGNQAQRKSFYAYARGKQSRGDVYSTKRILAVTHVSVMRKHGYGYLEEIVVRRADNAFYKFKEGDDVADFTIALRMFTRSLVIQKQRNRLMRYDELYKFSDGTLTRLLSSLEDITKSIDMEYLPKRRWSELEKKRAHFMIKDINKL
uniref:EF-hand domain-containing protein n=1 Tax=Tanacetum cinerariifolium TaxID=118510 RepID=A0A6L2ML40_TANCI|nr:hypothetical protein [Tanacetum cinerariifolium]